MFEQEGWAIRIGDAIVELGAGQEVVTPRGTVPSRAKIDASVAAMLGALPSGKVKPPEGMRAREWGPYQEVDGRFERHPVQTEPDTPVAGVLDRPHFELLLTQTGLRSAAETEVAKLSKSRDKSVELAAHVVRHGNEFHFERTLALVQLLTSIPVDPVTFRAAWDEVALVQLPGG